MKRRLVIVIGVTIIAVSAAAAFRVASNHNAKKRREAVYESTLQTYSEKLKPGLTRKQVESYLRTGGARFTQMCCIEERSTYADLVKIGEEDAPWYCSEHWVHIALVFAAAEPHDPLKPYDTDVLRSVKIFHEWGGCL